MSVSTHNVQSSLAQTFVKDDMPVIHATRDSDRCSLQHRCPDSRGWMGPRHPLGLAAQGAVDPAGDKLQAAWSASKGVRSTERRGNHTPAVLPACSPLKSLPRPSLLFPWPSPPCQDCPHLQSAQCLCGLTDEQVGAHGIRALFIPIIITADTYAALF